MRSAESEPEIPPGGYTPEKYGPLQALVAAWAHFNSGPVQLSDVNTLAQNSCLPAAGNSADRARVEMLMAQNARMLRYWDDWVNFHEVGDPGFPLVGGLVGFHLIRAGTAFPIKPTDPASQKLFEIFPSQMYWQQGEWKRAGNVPTENIFVAYGGDVEFRRAVDYIYACGRDSTHWRYYQPYRLGWISSEWAAERAAAVAFLAGKTGSAADKHMEGPFAAWHEKAKSSGLTHIEQCQGFAWARICYERGIRPGHHTLGEQLKAAATGLIGMGAALAKGDIGGALDAIAKSGAGAPKKPAGPPSAGSMSDRRIKTGWFGPPAAGWRNLDLAVMRSLGWFSAAYLAALTGSETGGVLERILGGASGVYDLVPGDDARGKLGNVGDAFGIYIDPSTPTTPDETKDFLSGLLKM